MKNHFEYLWGHPTALIWEDALDYSIRNDRTLHNLDKIKLPDKVFFKNKANNLRKDLHASDEDLRRWQMRVEEMFSNMVRSVSPIIDGETVFIGFSWKNGKEFALKIAEYIKEDFKEQLKVNIVDLRDAKDTLYQELINKMEASTIAVILFTKDLHFDDGDGYGERPYSKPNVYFEFGFLKRHLKKLDLHSGVPRTIIISEDKFEVASDVIGLGRFNFSKKVTLDYYELFRRFLQLHRTLTEDMAIRAINSFIKRVEDEHGNAKITNEDFGGKSLHDFIEEKRGELREIVQKKYRDDIL